VRRLSYPAPASRRPLSRVDGEATRRTLGEDIGRHLCRPVGEGRRAYSPAGCGISPTSHGDGITFPNPSHHALRRRRFPKISNQSWESCARFACEGFARRMIGDSVRLHDRRAGTPSGPHPPPQHASRVARRPLPTCGFVNSAAGEDSAPDERSGLTNSPSSKYPVRRLTPRQTGRALRPRPACASLTESPGAGEAGCAIRWREDWGRSRGPSHPLLWWPLSQSPCPARSAV
jgi:hypothetical protein